MSNISPLGGFTSGSGSGSLPPALIIATSQNVTVPAGVGHARIVAGGGGGGAPGAPSASTYTAQAGSQGGCQGVIVDEVVAVTAGHLLAVTIGAGGRGGTGGAAGGNQGTTGSYGGTTVVTDSTAGQTLIKAYGGNGGYFLSTVNGGPNASIATYGYLGVTHTGTPRAGEGGSAAAGATGAPAGVGFSIGGSHGGTATATLGGGVYPVQTIAVPNAGNPPQSATVNGMNGPTPVIPCAGGNGGGGGAPGGSGGNGSPGAPGIVFIEWLP